MIQEINQRIKDKITSGKRPTSIDKTKLIEYARWHFGEFYSDFELTRLAIQFILQEPKAILKAETFKSKLKIRDFKEIQYNQIHTLSNHELHKLQNDYRKSFNELILLDDINTIILAISRLKSINNLTH